MIRYAPFAFVLSLAALGALLGFSCSKHQEESGADKTSQINPLSGDNQNGKPDKKDEPAFPNIVPYLQCIPSAVDGQGKAVLTSSSNPKVIGSYNSFKITYTAGEAGIAPMGYLLLQVSPWWGWSQPQTLNSARPGYTTVEKSFDDDSFRISTLRMNRILVYSWKRGIKPGETVTFNYGPARVDKFAEQEELFQIFVDGDGDGHCACVKNTPSISILAAPPTTLIVNAQSRASPGEKVKVTACPVDPLGNWATFPEGIYEFFLTNGDKEKIKGSMVKTRAENGDKIISAEFTIPMEGFFFFRVEGPERLIGVSDVLFSQKGNPKLNLYFGDIHGHSRLSDGTGTPEDYYRYARDLSGLDIASLTDHSDYGTIQIEGEPWERIKKAANDANQPGEFVTFSAFEWTNWVYGHRNVYYRDGDGPIFRSFDEHSDIPQELWKLLEPYEAMTIAHHVGGGPIRTDWSIPPGPMEWLVEVSSIHGSSEYYRGERCIYKPVEGAFVRDALSKGYHLGIIASGDTHDGHPGKRSVGSIINGIVGIYSTELTRNAVWDAFKRRQVYGTSGPKIILFFRVCDSPMGSEVEWAKEKGAVPIAVMAVACDKIKAVEIVRNNQTVFSEKGKGVSGQFLIEDTKPVKGESWYYARVVQEDGEMAWSSPVWVTVK